MMLNTYIVKLKPKENVKNEIIDTMIATEEIPKTSLCLPC
jgi:hypothetical protein